MIRVTIELLPFGYESGKRTLGVVEIANTGTGTERSGNYVVRLRGANGRRLIAGVHVDGFARKSRHAWELLLEALLAVRRARLARRRWMG
jgi:hypothetical protein